MTDIKDKIRENTAVFDGIAELCPPLGEVAKKADINPGAIVAGVAAVICFFLVIFQGWNIMVAIAISVYPGICSIRAIETKEGDDDKKWLTYWMVFGLIQFVETFLGFIVYMIPYYEWIRLCLFGYLLIPQLNATETIYSRIIRPFMDKHKDTIKLYVDKFKAEATKSYNMAKEEATSKLQDVANDPTTMTTALNVA